MRRALEARFPDLEVVGTNYPPGSFASDKSGRHSLRSPCFVPCSAGESAACTRGQHRVHDRHRSDARRRRAVPCTGHPHARLSEELAVVKAANLRRSLLPRKHRCVLRALMSAARSHSPCSTPKPDQHRGVRSLLQWPHAVQQARQWRGPAAGRHRARCIGGTPCGTACIASAAKLQEDMMAVLKTTSLSSGMPESTRHAILIAALNAACRYSPM